MSHFFSHARPLDLIVSVIDNYGDMGMVLELIQSMHHSFPDIFSFFIWTDDVSRVTTFFDSQDLQGVSYQIGRISDFGVVRFARITCIFFHAPIPDVSCFEPHAYILRFDYISFDSSWIGYHGKEHILSTSNRIIEEYIPSILPGSGGVLSLNHEILTRDVLIQRFDLPDSAFSDRWIPCFLYPGTLNHIDWGTIPDDALVIVFGTSCDDILYPRRILLPLMNTVEFYSFFHHADWAIIRGEVSFVQILQMNIPFLWDMYKAHGGFPQEQSIQFLDTFSHGDKYREFHAILNGQISGKISFQNIDLFFSQYKKTGKFILPPVKNMILEVKKKIDRFEFSI